MDPLAVLAYGAEQALPLTGTDHLQTATSYVVISELKAIINIKSASYQASGIDWHKNEKQWLPQHNRT